MQPHIDREISKAQTKALQQQNAALLKQNQLLKQELAQLKKIQAHNQKQLSVYKNIVLKNSGDSQVLQLQHQRIFELETQLQMMKGKYTKLVKSGGSNQLTQYAMKCKEYERRLKESETQYQKQIATLKSKLSKKNAIELVQNKRLITSPQGEVKKSSLAVGKFV